MLRRKCILKHVNFVKFRNALPSICEYVLDCASLLNTELAERLEVECRTRAGESISSAQINVWRTCLQDSKTCHLAAVLPIGKHDVVVLPY